MRINKKNKNKNKPSLLKNKRKRAEKREVDIFDLYGIVDKNQFGGRGGRIIDEQALGAEERKTNRQNNNIIKKNINIASQMWDKLKNSGNNNINPNMNNISNFELMGELGNEVMKVFE